MIFSWCILLDMGRSAPIGLKTDPFLYKSCGSAGQASGEKGENSSFDRVCRYKKQSFSVLVRPVPEKGRGPAFIAKEDPENIPGI